MMRMSVTVTAISTKTESTVTQSVPNAYSVNYDITQYFTTPNCTMLHCTSLSHILLHYTVLYYIIQYYTILHYTSSCDTLEGRGVASGIRYTFPNPLQFCQLENWSDLLPELWVTTHAYFQLPSWPLNWRAAVSQSSLRWIRVLCVWMWVSWESLWSDDEEKGDCESLLAEQADKRYSLRSGPILIT